MKRTFRTMLLALFALALVTPIFSQFAVTVSFGPPALPVYDQPICPGDGFLWTPGYWAYDADGGYYWVPGTWVEAPEPGYLWTPAWWGWGDGGFLFHEGYWATDVGFYGGISYGYGYFGEGFQGGRWDHDHFFYNRAVLNIDVTSIHNVYNTTVINNVTVNRVSYNGGEGGITARPSPREQAVEQQRHIPPVAAQTQHVQAARSNPEMRAEANHGKPAVAATSRPGEFTGRGAVAAKAEGAPYHPAPSHPGAATEGARPAEGETPAPHNDNPTHARDLQPHQVQTAPSSGDPRADLKYKEQQQKLADQQNQEHQKLQQQQEKEDQQAAKRNQDQQKQQQMEQRHQQQTQQLEQKHTQQQQQLQTRQPAPRPAPHKPE